MSRSSLRRTRRGALMAIAGHAIRSGAWATMMVASMGCGDRDGGARNQVMRVPPQDLPTLVRRPMRVAAADRPDLMYLGITVRQDGAVSYVASTKDAPFLRILDTVGARVAAFGEVGDGPGEFRSPNRIWLLGDTLVVQTHAGGVFATFSRTGRFLEEFHTRLSDVSLGVTADSIDHFNPSEFVTRRVVRVFRTPLRGGRTREIFKGGDSLLALALRPSYEGQLRMALPYLASDNRVVIGDGLDYRLHVYDSRGRFLYEIRREVGPRYRGPLELELAREGLSSLFGFRGPNGERASASTIARQLDGLRTVPVPHFDKSAFFFDERGRLWVFGMANDSTVADIFADSVFVGRLRLPCFDRYGFRSLSGHWLALNCRLGDEHDPPYELQLYRIDP